MGFSLESTDQIVINPYAVKPFPSLPRYLGCGIEEEVGEGDAESHTRARHEDKSARWDKKPLRVKHP